MEESRPSESCRVGEGAGAGADPEECPKPEGITAHAARAHAPAPPSCAGRGLVRTRPRALRRRSCPRTSWYRSCWTARSCIGGEPSAHGPRDRRRGQDAQPWGPRDHIVRRALSTVAGRCGGRRHGDWNREAARGPTRWRDGGGAAVPACWARRGALSSTATGSARRDEGTSHDEEARREDEAHRGAGRPSVAPSRRSSLRALAQHAAGGPDPCGWCPAGPRDPRRGGSALADSQGAAVRSPSAGIESWAGARGQGNTEGPDRRSDRALLS